MATTNPPSHLGSAMTITRSNTLLPTVLIVLFVLMLGTAAYGFYESRRSEPVVVAVHDIPFGRQITAEDLKTIELPLHRPVEIAGITSIAAVVGQFAGRSLGAGDLVQPAALLATHPDQPVYPNGQQLTKDRVPIPFSTETVGPIDEYSLLNIGFNDPQGTPGVCLNAQQAAQGSAAASFVDPATLATGSTIRPFACRLIERARVLYVDMTAKVAYVELTPYQAHAVWAVQAAGLPLWGERYGATSRELPALEKLDLVTLDAAQLTAPLSATTTLSTTAPTAPMPTPVSRQPVVPGANTLIPGATPTSQPAAPPTGAAR